MPDDPTRCAMCGAIIVPAGEAWDHVGDPKPRHPAIPVGEWQPSPAGTAYTSSTSVEFRLNLAIEEIAGLRARLVALRAQAERDAPLVAAALAWYEAENEATAAHVMYPDSGEERATARAAYRARDALVSAARAHRAAAVDGDNPTE